MEKGSIKSSRMLPSRGRRKSRQKKKTPEKPQKLVERVNIQPCVEGNGKTVLVLFPFQGEKKKHKTQNVGGGRFRRKRKEGDKGAKN